MESNRRKAFKNYQDKIEIFETIMEQVNAGVLGMIGKESYDIPEEELEGLSYWDKQEHLVKDEEGLTEYTQPYTIHECKEDSWKQRQNEKFLLTSDAIKVVRQALDKWLDK